MKSPRIIFRGLFYVVYRAACAVKSAYSATRQTIVCRIGFAVHGIEIILVARTEVGFGKELAVRFKVLERIRIFGLVSIGAGLEAVIHVIEPG